MRRVTVQERHQDGAEQEPDEAARKRAAVELIRHHDRPLRWTARRYSICAEDAEDAYQRGIEIVLAKAPTADRQQLLPWTRTVVKHEALAIRKQRERTMARPGAPSDEDHAAEDWVQLLPAEGDGPDDMVVRRERVARSREALGLLKPAELKALTQLAEGFSYAEIGDLNGWTRTKVNRCLAEGRARFRSAFHDSEAGERCSLFEPLLSACCDGEIGQEQQAELEKHLAACGRCRSTLRAYRAAPRAAAALAPTVPFGSGAWERAQQLFLNLQLKLQGIGRGSDSGLQGLLAAGGNGGATAAVKLAAICAGTAGTAAACLATGAVPAVVPLPGLHDQPKVERKVTREAPLPVQEVTAPQVQVPVETPPTGGYSEPESSRPEPARSDPGEPTETAPQPTPTQAEFTPEASGTAVATTAAPPPPPPPSTSQSTVPIGNGGGEFAP